MKAKRRIEISMDSRSAKVLVGAIVAAAVGIFAVPFAAASTGTASQRHNSVPTLQLAQEDHEEQKEIEKETKELREDAATVPNAVKHEHEEKEARESESERHRLHHEVRETERHTDQMGNDDANAATNSVKSEHEEHETNDKVEHDQ